MGRCLPLELRRRGITQKKTYYKSDGLRHDKGVEIKDDWLAKVKVLGTGCLSLLEDIQIIKVSSFFHILFVVFCIIVYVIVTFCMLLFNFLNYVFALLCLCICMFRSGYSVSLCCSVHRLCVNVYCTAATACQHNCS